jgi:uncharacterized membrane protein YphA (DoxX/SURF4 family)
MYQPTLLPTVHSKGRRYLLYFLFLYILLYTFPFPFDMLVTMLQRFFSWLGELSGWGIFKTVNDAIDTFFGYYNQFWQWLVPWVGKHLLHLQNPITVFTNGSGDTTYDWVSVPIKALLALIGSGLWLLWCRPSNTGRLHQLLLLLLRYYLAYMMLSYGFAKLVQTQFPYPGLGRLVQPYGESSPMGLAWSFMGYSYGYNVFTGGCEAIAGLLLFFRRTQAFGALFAITVCTTIFVMNLCFDIPVKLFSFHLLLFAVFIAAADHQRITAFFFKGKEAVLRRHPYFLAGHRWGNRLRPIKWAIIVFLLYTNYVDAKKSYNEYGMGKPIPPLYGIYNAQYKIINSDTIPLLYNDTTHWKQFLIGIPGYARVRLLNDSFRRYVFQIDTVKRSVLLHPINDTSKKSRMSYYVQPGKLLLQGRVNGDSVQMGFIRYDESKMLLNSRGFHWVNESPFNY